MKKVIIVGNPISDNHLYGHRAMGKRVLRYMTAKGKAYKELVKMSIREPYTPYTGNVLAEIAVFFGDKRKRDIHGHLKAIFDSLEGIFYLDDKQVIDFSASKHYDKEMPRTVVRIIPLNKEDKNGN